MTASSLADPGRARMLRDAGRYGEAEAELQAWLAGRAAESEALELLVHVQLNQGKLDLAEANFDRLVDLAPRSDAAMRTRIRMLLRRQRIDEAVAAGRAAVAAYPDSGETTLVLAAALVAASAAREALALIDEVIARGAPAAQAYVARAQALSHLGRPAEAALAIEQALGLNPQMPLWSLLSSLRVEAGDRKGAAEAYRRSLEGQREDPAAFASLAWLERAAGRPAAARTLYERALAMQPGFLQARLGLAGALLELNDVAAARIAFDQALAEQPSLATFLKARLLLPGVVGSEAEIAELRAGCLAALEEAAGVAGEIGLADAATFPTWFYLAYHGLDDRPILEALDRLLAAKAPAFTFTAPQLAAWTPPEAAGRRIKVGFVSQFFYGHTNARLYAGLIAKLDRARFEVVVVHLPGGEEDALRAAIDRGADAAIRLPNDIAAQRTRLAAERFDLLFFTDLGMTAASYLLARARLAPVQATSWGYPGTTGLGTVDYFLSSDLIEPPDGAAAYTETLIRLRRLPSYYEGLPPRRRVDRAALGLPEDAVLYGCLQSLFKIHPQFDPVLAEIAESDAQARLVFIDTNPVFAAALRRRWARFPGLNERALFLPRVPVADFLNLTAAMDVILDPPHFGSGNTLYEAAGLGVPIVTWPGRFARGRIVAGAYAQMGVEDAPIAPTLERYAEMAVSLAHDPDRRRALGERIREGAAQALYADTQALRGIETFFAEAVAAAGRGETLPRGWSPSA